MSFDFAVRRWVFALCLCLGLMLDASAQTVSVQSSSSRVLNLGETAQLRLLVNNQSQPAFNGQIEWSLTDFWGVQRTSGSQALTIGAGGLSIVTVNLPATTWAGYAQVGLRLMEGATPRYSNSDVWALAVFEAPHTFPEDSPMGTYTIGNVGMLADIVPKGFYTDMAAAGVRWGTIDTWWSELEPTNNNYNWAFYDQWFQKAREAGITPIPHLFAIPQWVSSNPGNASYWLYPPTNIAEWRQFVRDFVTRYQDWLEYLRIWNEPNVGYWMGTPAQYAQLVIAASEEAKAIKPDIKIIVEVVDDSTQHALNKVYPFLNAVHAAGATPHWDVIAIHNYWLNKPNPPEKTAYELRYQTFIDWARAHKPDAKIWDTEFACMSETWGGGHWIGVGETNQARWLARAHAIGFSKGLEKMIWFPGYSWPDAGEAPFYNPAGLLASDLSPKPAYLAYRAVAVALSDAQFDSRLQHLGSNRHGMVFARPGGYVTLLWSVDDASRSVETIEFPGESELRVVNLMGETTTATLQNSILSIELKPDMQYVFSTQRPTIDTLVPVELSAWTLD